MDRGYEGRQETVDLLFIEQVFNIPGKSAFLKGFLGLGGEIPTCRDILDFLDIVRRIVPGIGDDDTDSAKEDRKDGTDGDDGIVQDGLLFHTDNDIRILVKRRKNQKKRPLLWSIHRCQVYAMP